MASHRLELIAKLAPPEPTGLLRRRLLDVASGRVGLVLAPAGHGKTTLLGQVAAAFPGPVAWYRFDVVDRRPQQAAAGIRRALLKPFGVGTPAQDADPQSDPPSLDRLVAALQDAPAIQGALLVLDDFHEIAGCESEQQLARFIAAAPSWLHVVLGARHVATLDLAALRMSGAVTVLDADDLRFRAWEVERLFRDVYREPLPPEDAARLTRRTEGWAAGLAMFHLLTAGRPPARRRQALGDLARGSRLVRSYLVREVLGDLPPQLRDFLRRTSALGVLTGPLCDRLLDTTGSQAVLEELEQRHLFTSTDDDGRRFRYHQVLLDHLELELTEQLGHDATRAWYTRAAELLLAEGEVRAAFRAYARAEDWAAVEQLLHRHGAEVVATPLGPVESLLPAELCSQDPWLLLANARRLVSRGALADAVATFRLAGSVAEDPLLAAVCAEEARAAALWLPGADPIGRGWAGLVRSATQRSPRSAALAALDVRGPEGRLAAGLATLGAGDLEQAATLLAQAADHPDAGLRVVALATCGRAVLEMLTERGPARRVRVTPDVDLEAVMLDVELAGWQWLARIGRALLEASAGDVAALDRLAAEADAVRDLWGAAVVRLLHGVAMRDGAALRDAAARLTDVDAPVLVQWAEVLAVAAAGPGLEQRLAAAAPAARAVGIRDALPVIAAWAAVSPPAVSSAPAAGTQAVPIVEPPETSAPGVDETPSATAAQATAAQATAAQPLVLDVRLLGGFEISVSGVVIDVSSVRPRARSTLRMLALHAGDVMHRDVLAGALWPDVEPEAALRSLQVAVSSLRNLLEPTAARGQSTFLLRIGDGYSLAMPAGSRSDVRELDADVAAARQARAGGDHAGERRALERAVAGYRGELLPEEGAAEWVVGERDRLRLAAATAGEALALCQATDGDTPSAVDTARECLRLDPYRDSGWRLLVDLHVQAGNQAAAQAARLQHGRVLAELGLPAEV